MCSMEFLEVVPGRNIGKLHVLKKVGNLNGEECFLCRDEKGRNIQFVESEIIAQAGDAPEVVEETPSIDESQAEESPKEETQEEKQEEGGADPSSKESVLESLMSKPIEDLEGQEIVTILIGVYDDNPPDDLTVEELRHRLEVAGKPEEKTPKEEVSKEKVKTKKSGLVNAIKEKIGGK